MLKRIHKRISYPYVALGLFAIATAAFFWFALRAVARETERTSVLLAQAAEAQSRIALFANMQLEARSVVVYDATNDTILFGKGQSTALPLASLTKIMTAIAGRTELSHDTPVTITPVDRTDSPDNTLRNKDTWTAYSLIQYSLMVSSNDGMTVICRAVTGALQSGSGQSGDCISFMNQYAENKGLTSLHFQTASGLDAKDGLPTNFGSAYDVARLLSGAYQLYPDLFAPTAMKAMTFKTEQFTYDAVNTDTDVGLIPNILAGKTGYTLAAGGNLAILYAPTPDTKVAIVVLGSSHEGRFSDMLELVRRTNDYVRTYEK